MYKRTKTKLTTSKIVSISIFAVVVIAGGLLYMYRHDLQRAYEKATLPEPVTYQDVSQKNALPTSKTVTQSNTTVSPVKTQPATPVTPPIVSGELPLEANLAIPFTAQAPHGIWEEPYKEFCEEASALMAVSYLRHLTIPNPDFAAAEMNKIKDFEDTTFGYYKDTTVAETARIIEEHFGYDAVTIIDDPTVEQIQEAVASGKPVIIPAAGRLLGNPHFTAPGPLYHMLVIKGYTKNGYFIANDPGTRFGADYLYSYETIMNAIHDWRDDQQIELGEKRILVLG